MPPEGHPPEGSSDVLCNKPYDRRAEVFKRIRLWHDSEAATALKYIPIPSSFDPRHITMDTTIYATSQEAEVALIRCDTDVGNLYVWVDLSSTIEVVGQHLWIRLCNVTSQSPSLHLFRPWLKLVKEGKDEVEIPWKCSACQCECSQRVQVDHQSADSSAQLGIQHGSTISAKGQANPKGQHELRLRDDGRWSTRCFTRNLDVGAKEGHESGLIQSYHIPSHNSQAICPSSFSLPLICSDVSPEHHVHCAPLLLLRVDRVVL